MSAELLDGLCSEDSCEQKKREKQRFKLHQFPPPDAKRGLPPTPLASVALLSRTMTIGTHTFAGRKHGVDKGCFKRRGRDQMEAQQKAAEFRPICNSPPTGERQLPIYQFDRSLREPQL
jgi:hypothetical protein